MFNFICYETMFIINTFSFEKFNESITKSSNIKIYTENLKNFQDLNLIL